ncbi:ribosomal-protein-serine acetyltransferase [Pelagirhabdus alkalitolerans]|uniref:Ribosomal-protein-serine acetyltransferase n=1 Tax=Pelagirhabdus alkalitolerans TaxID=1612202 RepID=A0A1G6KHS3_9BACI|nr:GNAT family protein [Pelagirhabdus alkalitolerans]SDC30580.1 ribosomal-protein-serine acetyltransferase [Pelagirhabdus alkalitolerans]
MFRYNVTDSIALKLLEKRDADKLFDLISQSRQHLREFLGFVDYTYKVDDTRKFVNETVIENAEEKSFVVVLLYDEAVCGLVGFNSLDHTNKTGEIGYWIAEPYLNQGITTKATQAIIDYGFHHFNLNRIQLKAAFYNKPSRRVAEKLQFKEEGVLREAEMIQGQYVDHCVYSLLRREWESQNEVDR